MSVPFSFGDQRPPPRPADAAARSSSHLHSKVLRIGNFRLGKTIGVGSFGKVKVAEHVATGHKVAIKILNRSKIRSLRMDIKITREIANLKLFRHPHIIKLYEVIETPSDIFMVMEYVPGGELFDYIVAHGKLSEPEARRFFQQIVAAIDYCHSHMVVHRDLKPENLLISSRDNSVKIADFGLSTMMKDGEFLKTSCGSPNYAAPEVISGKLYAGPEVDVWSCGVILYTLVCARLPFDDDYIPALFKKIRSGQYAVPAYVSQDCADLIRRMLVVDPLDRMTTVEIMQHKWFVVDLPPYLAAPAPTHQLEADALDDGIIQEIADNWEHAFKHQSGSGVPEPPPVDLRTVRDFLEEAATTNTINEYVVAYNLIQDARDTQRHKRELEELQARAEGFAGGGSLPPNAALYATSPPINLREGFSLSYGQLQPPSHFDDSAINIDSRPKFPDPSSRDAADRDAHAQNQWFLGLATSQDPRSVMQNVYRAVCAIGLEWKLIGPWALHARPRQRADNTPEMEDVATPYDPEQEPEKLGLQLYKVKDGKYLLDIKLLQGDTFKFFDVCNSLLGELKL